ncbi:MAG: uroporphyrinogen decarboxylase family protein [Bacillota bacterium]|nr:uroporphyrinogen decarboxylase family protein [Bacillota bacterium]
MNTLDTLEKRLARFKAAIDLKMGDRTPVSLMMDYKFPCRYKGVTQGAYFRDRSIGTKLLMDVFDELGGWDIGRAGGNTTGEQNLLEAPMVIKVPGKDIGEDDVIQWEEREVITVEDYDKIIKVGWKRFMDDFYPKFRGWDHSVYHTRVESRASREREAINAGMKRWLEKGYPLIGGGDVFPPLMMLSSCRSMTKFALDLHRMPDKVQAVMDAMVDDLIDISIRAAKGVKIPEGCGILTKSLIMERGGGFYFPLKIFERFEMPYLKKMVEAFVREGITPILHFDQDWTLNLPYLKELPRAKCFMQLDSKTNIFKAKEILGGHMCIMGDVPPSLLSLGTPEEVSVYCRKLIETVGKGGGFVLGVGCGVPVDAKFDNLKAMLDAPRTYHG